MSLLFTLKQWFRTIRFEIRFQGCAEVKITPDFNALRPYQEFEMALTNYLRRCDIEALMKIGGISEELILPVNLTIFPIKKNNPQVAAAKGTRSVSCTATCIEPIGFLLKPGSRSSKEKWDGWKSAADSSPALGASYWLSCDNSVWQMQQHAATFLQFWITDQIKSWPAKLALLCSVVEFFLLLLLSMLLFRCLSFQNAETDVSLSYTVRSVFTHGQVSGMQLLLRQETYRVMGQEIVQKFAEIPWCKCIFVGEQVSLPNRSAVHFPHCTHSSQLSTLLPLHSYFT